MIGTIFHYGIYSVPAFDETNVNLRKTKNGSEWYKARLEETSDFRPIAGHKATKKYHQQMYGDKQYNEFEDIFKCEKMYIDNWCDVSKKIGAKYAILTAKHHDGYCLWDTDTTMFNSVSTGPKINILQEFKNSTQKYGLKFGIYFSLFEFGKSVTKDFMSKILIPQMLELLKYNPDYLWLDGHWNIKTKIATKTIIEIICKFKTNNINILINDRICLNEEINKKYSDYRVYSDRFIPLQKLDHDWQHITTIGNSWGHNKMQTEYKSGIELMKIYQEVVEKGGRFLINFGPRMVVI
jgi:alpha-L-fucosidase